MRRKGKERRKKKGKEKIGKIENELFIFYKSWFTNYIDFYYWVIKNNNNNGSWHGNVREEVSCMKYIKIWIIVNTDDWFRGWGMWRILKYYTVKKISCCKRWKIFLYKMWFRG
jgi:hypothetical protein